MTAPAPLTLPFAYFLTTRLRQGSLAFHVLFEWGAALVVAAWLAGPDWPRAVLLAAISYLAFISLYEIGYLVNDRFAARRESGGQSRGQGAVAPGWVALWIAARLAAFALATTVAGAWPALAWWGFFGGLALVFALHNLITDREIRAITFIWLAWFRFMAPLFWVVPPAEFAGIGLAAAMVYVMFRQFGYLDSKGLLAMPGRQRPRFRLAIFGLPLIAVPAFLHFPGTRGLVLLLGYFATMAAAGTLASLLNPGARPVATPGTSAPTTAAGSHPRDRQDGSPSGTG